MTELLPDRRRVAVIYNPVAGFFRRRRLVRFLRLLKINGHDVHLRRTQAPGDAIKMAAGLHGEDTDVVVAAGGDGTVNEVLNGLGASSLPLAVLPLGTANVLGWELGFGTDVAAAANAVASGKIVDIPITVIGERRFLLMASAGADARVVARVSTRLKRWAGKGAYLVAALGELLRDDPMAPVTVEIDGDVVECGLVVLTHAARYGGPFIVARNTRLSDPYLTVLLLHGRRGWRGRLDLTGHSVALLTGRVERRRGVTIRHARHVRFLGPANAPIQADGDLVTHMPAEVSITDAYCRLIVPDAARVHSIGPRASEMTES